MMRRDLTVRAPAVGALLGLILAGGVTLAQPKTPEKDTPDDKTIKIPVQEMIDRVDVALKV
ncbi:MAG: hypothetical protein HY042_02290, partial [Spirochaetia bacterium]|nr:hypothetical protein [Spirochaetia bacterium]